MAGSSSEMRSGWVEFYAGMLRVSRQDNAKHGDSYSHAIGLRWINPQTVELAGVHTAVPPSAWRIIMIELQKLGVEKIVVCRLRNGELEKHTIDVLKHQTNKDKD